MKKTLNGDWKFRQLGESVWKNATVPGCNFLDLMANGDIPDPFVGLNESKVVWVGRKDWEYSKKFSVTDDEMRSDDILLCCKMLDTVCDVYVNERLAFHGENCFRAYSESVKNYLHSGENTVRIVFFSPVRYVEKRYKELPAPMNSNGQNGIVHIRKPQCHFGWDWGPILPCSGITGDIELEFVDTARIEYLAVTQKLSNNTAVIKAKADIMGYGEYECETELISPNGKCETKQGSAAEFLIEDPELWWMRELSGKDEQPLYTVKVLVKAHGETVDSEEKRIGIRTIELDRERDEFGRNFKFILNGVPLFIKGANYIPPDSFITRFTEDKLEKLIDAALFSNMNMLRIWGGGYYESDEFYSMCDRKGILIWQDFQFACQAYPFFDESFLENVKEEVKYNVSRLCHHPSLAVWNGNNEIEQMHMAWVHMKKYVDWTEKFFYGILEPEIRKYDGATPYTPGSPVGVSHNSGVDSDNVGDTHLWGVWHGLKPMDYYRKRMTRFCSEFGFESLPDMKAIEKFAEPSDYSISSEVFKAHQKCANGNDKMIYYIASRFDLPKRFEDLVYLSQVTQNECISDATEHWRRNKGRCNGSMYWQFNDCWGVCSWSSLDYYGNYKALQYGARHFNSPLAVSVEDSREYIKIFALNDMRAPEKITAEYEIFDFYKGTLESDCKEKVIGAAENLCLFEISMEGIRQKFDLKRTGLAARLIKDGKLVQQKVLLFGKEKDLDLPKAKLKTEITKEKDGLSITLTTDSFARLVKIDSRITSEPFSDNFFDILPGESKTVTIRSDGKHSIDELAESISAFSLTDIPFDKSKVRSVIKRAKVYASPTNLANTFYHGKLSKDAKLD